MIFCCRIFSGLTKLTHTNFCPEIGLSSSSKSAYLGFDEPSTFFGKSLLFSFRHYNFLYIHIFKY